MNARIIIYGTSAILILCALAAAAEREAKLREALGTMIVGACAVGVPRPAEREVLKEAVAIARAVLASTASTAESK